MKIKGILVLVLLVLVIGLIWIKNGNERPPVTVPVLTYHNVVAVNYSESTSNVTYEKFKNDLEALKREGYSTILFKDLYAYLKHGVPLPPKPVLLTFDDGYWSNYEYVYPLLLKMDMKASFFVIGWSVGESAKLTDHAPIIPHFSWDNAREMVKSGRVEIQSHTHDLHDLPGMSSGYGRLNGYGLLKMKAEKDGDYRHRVEGDLLLSVSEIIENVGVEPTVLSYPFGAHDKAAEKIVHRFFSGSVTTKKEVREYRSPRDLYEIPRIGVKESTDVIQEIERLVGE